VLEIPVLLWVRLVRQLHRRGGRRRESGAFLLGRRNKDHDRVKAFACYDDLDPHALDTGVVTFDPSGFAALWALCRRLGCEVLADAHTHPDAHPQQSETDRTNPMMPEVGHMALILPSFAGTWGWKFRNVAIYEYAGDYHWRDWAGPRRAERVRFCWW
jgi:proteasome lid subunit RPN8/RPN11